MARPKKEAVEEAKAKKAALDAQGMDFAKEEALQKVETTVPKTNAEYVEEEFKKAEPLVMHVHIDFVDEILGTAAGSEDIHGDYIASKAPDAMSMSEEIEAIGAEGVREKGMTVFPRNKKGEPIFWNYQIKGFFKSACQAQKMVTGSYSGKVKAYKRKIDLGIFVFADANDKAKRDIVIHTDKAIGECQRPLRAQTAQGERVAIADSECIAPGAWIEFSVVMLDPHDKKLVCEWLDYGIYNGIGQWRNAGKGAFTWKEMQHKPSTIWR